MWIDSGSTYSFVSIGFAEHLLEEKGTIKPLAVRIADGGLLTCDQEISGFQWWVQEVPFCTNLKLLPLKGYDVIIGMDWLSDHSPMTVHSKSVQSSPMQNDLIHKIVKIGQGPGDYKVSSALCH